jgi:acetyl-CoA carboxylase biotin carboxyl carrier protein
MEVKQINQLMLAMGRYGIKALCIKKEGFELSLEREGILAEKAFETLPEETEENPLHGDFARRRSQHVSLGASEDKIGESGAAEALTKEDESGLFIESPMVGTVYLSPTPQEAPYVCVGDKVSEDTVVCIVEAMKVMNEVRAGVAGVIVQVFAENAHPVEYGSKLFKIVSK